MLSSNVLKAGSRWLFHFLRFSSASYHPFRIISLRRFWLIYDILNLADSTQNVASIPKSSTVNIFFLIFLHSAFYSVFLLSCNVDVQLSQHFGSLEYLVSIFCDFCQPVIIHPVYIISLCRFWLIYDVLNLADSTQSVASIPKSSTVIILIFLHVFYSVFLLSCNVDVQLSQHFGSRQSGLEIFGFHILRFSLAGYHLSRFTCSSSDSDPFITS